METVQIIMKFPIQEILKFEEFEIFLWKKDAF